jgi:hypothetical protein
MYNDSIPYQRQRQSEILLRSGFPAEIFSLAEEKIGKIKSVLSIIANGKRSSQG